MITGTSSITFGTTACSATAPLTWGLGAARRSDLRSTLKSVLRLREHAKQEHYSGGDTANMPSRVVGYFELSCEFKRPVVQKPMAGKDLQLVSGPPPVGGGPGTLGPQQRRTVRATALVPSAASPVKGAHQLSAGYGGDHNVQAKLVQNLQQQVFFLELELKYLREQRGSTLSGAKPTEGRPDAAAQEQGREQTSALREAMLRAEFRKEQAQADKAKAIGELGRLRDKFTAQLQELTAEVVGLQSALEQRNQAEKMLRMDLAEMTNKYEERKAFTEGYDTRVKLLEVKIDELSAEVQRARVREQELRKELLEAQQTSQAFESKAAAQAATARHTAAQRREALGEAEAAAVRLREEEMKQERELQARRQADEQAAFLVRENAKLKTALAELSISAERLASDNATAQQDNDSNKMVKVLSRWMIRKMRDKLTVTLEEQRNQEVRIHDLHEKLVRARPPVAEAGCTRFARSTAQP